MRKFILVLGVLLLLAYPLMLYLNINTMKARHETGGLAQEVRSVIAMLWLFSGGVLISLQAALLRTGKQGWRSLPRRPLNGLVWLVILFLVSPPIVLLCVWYHQLYAPDGEFTMPQEVWGMLKRAWVAIMLAGLLVLMACSIVSSRRFHRLKDQADQGKQLCDNCGYDLTGNVSGVCPECGRRVVKSPERGTCPA